MAGNAAADPGLGAQVRALIRCSGAAALGSVMPDGTPYVSLVEIASDMRGEPLLLMSDLAQHTQNLGDRSSASLLLVAEQQDEALLAGTRVSLMGKVVPESDEQAAQRYLARHLHAVDYAAMGDFRFYRFVVERAHVVAGFGRIAWLDAADVVLTEQAAEPLRGAEPGIVSHMNEDHADAILLYATVLNHEADGDWAMTGIDPDGADLRHGRDYSRVVFESPVQDAAEARAALVALVKSARAKAG